MTLRAFAKFGESVRFLADSDDPSRIVAQEKCTGLHHRDGDVDMYAFWHSAGYVLIKQARLAARHNLAMHWAGRPHACAGSELHYFDCSGATVRVVLVALDTALEQGMPMQRKLRDLRAPPEPPAANQTREDGASEGTP